MFRVMRAMLVRGLKSIQKLDHLNGKNPEHVIPYTDLVSGMFNLMEH